LQFDIILVTVGIVVLFLTAGLTLLFNHFFKEIAGKVKERLKPDIRVKIESAVHTFDGGLNLHSVDLSISNTAERETRINNITIFDKLGRELRYVTRGHTSPVTEFGISGTETQRWFVFCRRESTGEFDSARLRLAIERKGKRTLWKSFESRSVPHEEFPTGEWFHFF